VGRGTKDGQGARRGGAGYFEVSMLTSLRDAVERKCAAVEDLEKALALSDGGRCKLGVRD
jgi:hypothetical protein